MKPPSSSCGTMALADCQAKCASTAGCEGVTVSAVGNGLFKCYRKGMIQLGNCDAGPSFDTPLAQPARTSGTQIGR